MNRRQFLRATVAVTASAPSWSTDGPPITLAELRREAEAAGVALLVALVPADPAEAARRGHLWGDLLDRGEVVMNSDLHLVSCCAAKTSEVATDLPEQAVAALYDPGRSVPRVLTPDGLPASPREFARLLTGFLHPDRASLEARLGDLERPWLGSSRPETRVLRLAMEGRLAAWDATGPKRARILADALRPLFTRRGWEPRFERARLEYLSQTPGAGPGPPSGPQINTRGCNGVPCGTAHIPPTGRRFLRFYVDD